jgi:hypothetical protein
MQRDAISYGHDLAIVKEMRTKNPPTRPAWHKSAASILLKQDVDAELHKEMKPKELHKSRAEYRDVFDLKTFRKHLYQEIDSRPKREIRFEKKKKAWLYPELHGDQSRLRDSNIPPTLV